jgi:hypothetical protein
MYMNTDRISGKCTSCHQYDLATEIWDISLRLEADRTAAEESVKHSEELLGVCYAIRSRGYQFGDACFEYALSQR